MPKSEKKTLKPYSEEIKSLKEKLRQNKEPEKLFNIVSFGLDVVAALGTSVPLFGTYMKLLSKGAQVAKSAMGVVVEDKYQDYKSEKESTGFKDEENTYFPRNPTLQKTFQNRYEYEKKWEALKDRFDKIKEKDKDKDKDKEKDKEKEKEGPKNGSGGSGGSGSGSGG